MSVLPAKYSAERAWSVPEALELAGRPAFLAAWWRSQSVLRSVRAALQTDQLDPAVATVAASGSLGRMEMLPHSDCDLIVVLQNNVAPGSSQAQTAWESVWTALKPLSLAPPKPRGIYASPATTGQLLDPGARGRIDEAPAVFGKRIQLLLDAQPVYGDEAFDRLLDSVIAWYVPQEADAAWAFLQDDLVRYFRSLAVKYRWEARDDPQRWRMRNLKLGHSRMAMHAGLLFSLAECAASTTNPAKRLKDYLRLTPLERLARVYADNERAAHFAAVADPYEVFLDRLGDESFRRNLAETSDPLHTGRSDDCAERLRHQNAAALRRELVQFVMDRRESWGAEFVDSLVF